MCSLPTRRCATNALNVIVSLSLRTYEDNYCPYFINEETENQRSQVASPMSHS